MIGEPLRRKIQASLWDIEPSLRDNLWDIEPSLRDNLWVSLVRVSSSGANLGDSLRAVLGDSLRASTRPHT